jgi:hypothetical protein
MIVANDYLHSKTAKKVHLIPPPLGTMRRGKEVPRKSRRMIHPFGPVGPA